ERVVPYVKYDLMFIPFTMKIYREPSEAKKFLQLATAQRMNTDARKAILCVLMGAEDYLDAFEKLLKLDLSGKQYCLWDYYKELDSMELIQLKNLATFNAEMLMSFSLSRSLEEATVWNIFTRVGVTPELEPLRNGLQFFIKQYVVNADHADKSVSNKFKIARKASSNMEGILM
ncbi:hypothetical protein IFM89_016989, partial [Coptis chinensis]